MKRLLEKIEALMAAVAFAEEGEVEAARQIMTEAGLAESGDPDGRQDRAPQRLCPPRAARASRT